MGKITTICLNCQEEKEVNNNNKYSCLPKFCSIKCQQEHRRKERIRLWLDEGVVPDQRQIKKYLVEKFNNTCYTCGITEWNNKPIVLDLEHIDGNSENNNIENLCLLCPNCHSQTDTFKGANKGKGRHSRRIRYAQGKSY